MLRRSLGFPSSGCVIQAESHIVIESTSRYDSRWALPVCIRGEGTQDANPSKEYSMKHSRKTNHGRMQNKTHSARGVGHTKHNRTSSHHLTGKHGSHDHVTSTHLEHLRGRSGSHESNISRRSQ